MDRKVFVLLLNWKNWRDTNNCLSSLEKLEYGDWKVLVIDNGSKDGSVERIRERFPEIEILELGDNGGFAKGNNAGIKVALEKGAEYIWLLNNDTTVDPMALRALVEKAEATLNVGAVGSAIYFASQPNRLQAWGGGRVNFWLGGPRHFQVPVAEEKVEFLTGASMLLKRSVLESTGLLDEEFFMFWEDGDYCFRMRKAGYCLGVASQSRVWHKGSASFESGSSAMDVYFTRSSKRFFQKHASFPFLSFWTGVTLRSLKRGLSGRWENLGATWSAARE